MLEDLARMPTISMWSASDRHVWHFASAVSETVEMTHSPRLSTDDLHTLRVGALSGIGAACVPTMLVSNDLASGALVRIIPTLRSQSGILHAVFPSRRGMVPAVRSLLDFLAENVAARALISVDAN